MPTIADPLPLAGHMLFRSRDLDEARERVARVFCPHRLETLAERHRFDARQHHLRGQCLSLNYIEYGARTLIAPGELGHFYLLQFPLAGGARIEHGPDRYDSTPRCAAVLNPHLPTRMTWAEGTRQVLVQIDRAALQARAEALGLPAPAPATFRGGIELGAGPGAALARLVLWLVAEADAGRPPLGAGAGGGLLAQALEEAVIAGLLDAAAPLPEARAAPPRHIRAAEAFIAANLDRPLSVAAIAAAAGTGVRALQAGFRAHRGTTPLGRWRELRLEAARAELAAGGSGTSVTDVALRWGFDHLGRFAGAYRARFGESPRDTLRRGS
jgi:AraC-like DNA-binding protein